MKKLFPLLLAGLVATVAGCGDEVSLRPEGYVIPINFRDIDVANPAIVDNVTISLEPGSRDMGERWEIDPTQPTTTNPEEGVEITLAPTSVEILLDGDYVRANTVTNPPSIGGLMEVQIWSPDDGRRVPGPVLRVRVFRGGRLLGTAFQNLDEWPLPLAEPGATPARLASAIQLGCLGEVAAADPNLCEE